jgi:hypothetical protein
MEKLSQVNGRTLIENFVKSLIGSNVCPRRVIHPKHIIYYSIATLSKSILKLKP